MTSSASIPKASRPAYTSYLVVAGRWLLGAMFIYMGLTKVMHPLEFLKLVRQYDIFSGYLGLNLVAALIPWLELFCGVLLVVGLAVRGTAVVVFIMLIAFTTIVILRASEIYAAGGLPFCAIKFDCGCGSGEVVICRKLAENALLTVLAGSLIVSSSGRR